MQTKLIPAKSQPLDLDITKKIKGKDRIVGGIRYKPNDGTVNRVYFTLYTLDTEIEASYNPHSITFWGDVSSFLEAFSAVSKLREIKLPNLDELVDNDDDAEVSNLIAESGSAFGAVSQAIENLNVAADKIFGEGKARAILAEDDEEMTLFYSAFKPIFDEQKRKKSESDKAQRANAKAETAAFLANK